MAQASITKLESVIAGIRSYLSEQLGELDNELEAARKEVAELSEQLASKQASVEVLVAGRDLLVAKLGELDGAVAETATVPKARQSREDTDETTTQETVAAAEVDAVVDELPATEPAATEAETPATAAKALNASQRNVLDFLEATPGVHKVAEIATGVNGPDAGNAAVQTVRRALAVLTGTGQAMKSTQSGTAFYSATSASATSASSTVAEELEASPQDVDAEEPVRAVRTRTSASPRARSAKAGSKKATPTKAAAKKATAKKTASRSARAAATATPAATAEPVAESTTTAETEVAAVEVAAPARVRKAAGAASRTTKKTASAPVEKSVRADRTKIVATLLVSPEPQSAAEVSRTVMGSEWKSSDATNFRNVLKSMVAEGVVAEHVGENNRSRYTVAASS
ncbi:hypothetical protein [Streptacidiphilus sp. MAP12-16]|uniref:hypothetical protein n=1 Tax=Streptacidiphilus sp. MAP12-16 TaxID=3156300 RepID=UPI003511E779